MSEKKTESRVLKKVLIEKIKTDPNQPRKHFDEEKLNELAASIKAEGLKVPIFVKPDSNHEKDGSLLLVAGERRLRACKKLGLKEIEAIIIYGEVNSYLISLLENVARENINPIEEANAFSKLVKEDGYNYGQLAQMMGKSIAFVGNRIALLKLPQEVQNLIILKKLQISLAQELLNNELAQDDVIRFAHKAVKEGLSANRLNEKIKSLINEKKAKESGVKIFSEEEKLMLNAKKNMPFFLEKIAEYVILIEEMDPIDRKVFFIENFKKSDRGLMRLGLAKIAKRAATLIKSLEEMESGTN